jgi:hypothetical protein
MYCSISNTVAQFRDHLRMLLIVFLGVYPSRPAMLNPPDASVASMRGPTYRKGDRPDPSHGCPGRREFLLGSGLANRTVLPACKNQSKPEKQFGAFARVHGPATCTAGQWFYQVGTILVGSAWRHSVTITPPRIFAKHLRNLSYFLFYGVPTHVWQRY